jgi:xanthine dehydrogenase/oxidase
MPENYLFVVEPEEIFCSLKVLYHGQPVGIILANSFELANNAANLVEIFYTSNEKLKVRTSLEDVIEDPERTMFFPDFCKKGKIIENNSSASHKISGRFKLGGQYHFSIETQSCVCVPIEDGMDVYSATQWMDATQIAIAEAINLPNNVVNMHVRRLGGGFGGKISRAAHIAAACSIGAFISNRPVRLILTLEANMAIIGKRYPCVNDYKVEVDRNGKILKLHNEYVEDYGCSFNEPAYLTTGFFGNCYDSQSYNVIAKKAKTDTASNTWCRGPGTLEGISMIENIMEHIAFRVGRDPLDVRTENIPRESVMRKYLMEFAESTGKNIFIMNFNISKLI